MQMFSSPYPIHGKTNMSTENGTGGNAAIWLMRRLRKEFGLEFIYVDLSDIGRWKVLEYAAYLVDQERKYRNHRRILPLEAEPEKTTFRKTGAFWEYSGG